MNGWGSFNAFGGYQERSGFQSFVHEMPLFFKLMFLLVIGFFVFVIFKSLKVWLSNNASPQLSAQAIAVTKRTEVWGGSGDSSASTSYYVTFEFQDGQRVELMVPDKEFGLIVEGDRGQLSYQGTRFKGFVR
ncbi:DUF2500 domain-containing protein [Paenibacillus jilunlii]|uniref:DUF2500 domain-containing protein n=1 Tax=Paenibacillus jilunlii TaxID=682956 RepID=UPI001FCC9A50|nr:DUF2500 domain-containing protein [Paenibacillus jilunlii]